MFNYDKFSQKIQIYRKKEGYTQAQLANMLSVELSYISSIENKKKNPSTIIVIAILNIFNASLNDFLNENNINEKELKINEILKNIHLLKLNDYNKRFLLNLIKHINERGSL